MEKSSPKKFVLIVIPIFPYQRTGSNMKRNSLSYQIIFKTVKKLLASITTYFPYFLYCPVEAPDRLAPLIHSGATSLAVGKSSCASLTSIKLS